MTQERTTDDVSGSETTGERAEGFTERSTAEWVTLSVSIVIVVGMIGLVIWLTVRGGLDPARIDVTPAIENIRQEGDDYYLPVDISNGGDDTVEDVVIEGELDTGEGEPEVGQITVTFLAGGEQLSGTLVFTSDPAQGDLTVRVTSFKEP